MTQTVYIVGHSDYDDFSMLNACTVKEDADKLCGYYNDLIGGERDYTRYRVYPMVVDDFTMIGKTWRFRTHHARYNATTDEVEHGFDWLVDHDERPREDDPEREYISLWCHSDGKWAVSGMVHEKHHSLAETVLMERVRAVVAEMERAKIGHERYIEYDVSGTPTVIER